MAKQTVTDATSQGAAFLAGGGEMGERIRAHDWASTPLGPVEGWPQALRTLVQVLLGAAHPMLLIWGPQRTVMYNDATLPMWSRIHPAALGASYLNDVLRELRDDLGPLVDRAFGGETVHLTDLPVTFDRNGYMEESTYSFSYTPVRNLDGIVEGLICPIVETSGLVFAERKLRELNETLEQQVVARTAALDRSWQLSQELLVIASPDGFIEAVNPMWTAVLGWERHELIGKPFMDFTHPDDLETTIAAFAGILERSLTAPYEYRFRHKDGSYRWFGWTGAFENGKVYASGRHITLEREQAEALRQSQKMEAVGQLTGGLAHDFNNLLTGMMGNLELLQLRVARGRLDDLDRFINAAQGAGRRAANLTQRLLAFSRRQTLDPKPTDVNRLIMGLEEMLRRTVGATANIEIVGAAGLWTADIDASQLENAVLNLCINARDAMPDGGRIVIETANKWIDDHASKARDLPPGQYISVCVTDTGTGMAPDVIARAFDPFYTTKPIGQGTGLGLSMIYGFAQQSGGQVRIYSEVGQGTTVCIYLPRHHGEADDDAIHIEAAALESASGQTVLVVDDEATIRHLIDEVLDDLGYTVIGAADGAAGIKVLQSGARIELLITDVGLPNGMNGRQVADEARRLRPGLKVLFITGFAENAAVGNGFLEPGMELLTKPFTLEALANKVGDMMKAVAV